jgi:predicted enzyme related to lactoylglutathione lyase
LASTATLKDISATGGKIITPRLEVKGIAAIGLFNDPAGNTMGLVEMTSDNKVKVP